MITIYTIAYNEELMLPYFVSHYRKNFPGCNIVVYDNESSDKTIDIALQTGCEVRTFETGNTLSDRTYLEIKNKCWKDSKTDWVIIADVDEFVQLQGETLFSHDFMGHTILKFEGYNMVNHNDDLNILGINRGVRSQSYDKLYCFNKRHIQEINYVYGCHKAHPVGNIKYNNPLYYKCFHYKYINIDYMIARHETFAKRLSKHNRKLGLGGHYLYTPEAIKNDFLEARENSIQLI